MAAAAAGRQSPPLAAADIVRLVETGGAFPDDLLTSTPHSTILSLVRSPPPSFSPSQYLCSLLPLFPRSVIPDPSLSPLLSSLLSAFIGLFFSQNVPRDKDSAKVFHLFSLLFTSLSKSLISPIINDIVSHLPDIEDSDDAQPLDLLSQLLHLVKSIDEIEGNAGSIDSVIDEILGATWSKTLLFKMVTLIREFPPLGKSRSQDFLEKVFVGMRAVDLQDIPSLAYNLLVLASKGFPKKRLVEGIVTFFGARPVSAIARQIEGTVLLHVNFAVKQDPSLGQEVLGLVRSDLRAFNHFTVAVLFAIARVRRFNENAMSALRTAVVTAYRDYHFARDCEWMPDILKGGFLRAIEGVENVLMRAVKESTSGRDLIIPTLVQFGFILLESCEGKKSEELRGSDTLMGTEELAIQSLKTLFEVHDMARKEIIERCKFHILSKKSQRSTPFINLLGGLIQSYPYPMLEHIGQIKELLEYLIFMNEKISSSLITVLLPLIKFRRDLLDYTILVVRKAMFRKSYSVQSAATSAIIDLIMAEKKSKKNSLNFPHESSSQASCSQHSDVPYASGMDLFQEFSGLLRRCLYQEAIVKEIMYKGLLKLVLSEPSFSGRIFNFLWHHFLRFYFEDDGVRLKLSICVKLENGKVCLEEPLDCLLSCVSWILLLQLHENTNRQSEFARTCLGFSLSQENEAANKSCAESFLKAFAKIRAFLRSGSPEDVMAKCWDPDLQAAESEKNSCCILVLLGIVEVVINFVATELEKASEEDKEALEKEIMKLFDLYDHLEKTNYAKKQETRPSKSSMKTASENLLEKTSHSSKEAVHALPLKFSQRGTFFSASSVHQLLLYSLKLCSSCSSVRGSSQNHTPSSLSKKLAPPVKFVSFALRICHHHLKSFTSVEQDELLKGLFYADIKVLGLPLLQLILLLKSDLKLEKDQKRKEGRGKKLAEDREEQMRLALICLLELFKISSSTCFNSLLEDMLSASSIDSVEDEDMNGGGDESIKLTEMTNDPCIRNLHLFLGKKLKPLLSELIARSHFRGSEVLCEIVSMIGSKLPCKLRNLHGSWAIYFCRSSGRNPKAAQSIAGLAIYLRSCPSDLIVAHEVASELLKVVGSEDMDPTEKSDTYPIINLSTHNAIALLLLQFSESVIADIDSVVSKAKRLSNIYSESSEVDRNNHSGDRSPELILEEALYSRSEGLVNLLSRFAEMNLKDTQANHLLKLTARFYKSLARMTKLRIAPRGCKQRLPGHEFQKLTEVTCRKLTVPLYNFVAMVQRNQQENVQKRGMIKRIQRENKCIPDLIYKIEDYEKYLIQLSTVTKVDLLRHAKRSTARDFKILDAKVTVKEDQAGDTHSPANSNVNDGDSNEDSEREEEDGSPQAAPPQLQVEADANDSASESEKELVVRRKRAKTCNIVEDSDED